jgi:arylsulfatase A-like enzyme
VDPEKTSDADHGVKKLERREFLKLTSFSISLSALGVSCRSEVNGLPNIILCMADDQGWGDMAYAGHTVLKTPNFDEMSREALRFDRFYAAAPVCSPTRGSVLTGRHPNRFGCFSWGHTLRPQEITVAEALRTAGYITGHFGKWHVGSVQSNSPVNPGASGFDRWFSAPNFFDNDPILSREGTAEQASGESSIVTAEAAIEFIREQVDSAQPFLALVWFGSPHSPHRAAEMDRIHYEDQEEMLQHFYGEITGMDRAFGMLRRELQDLGISDNTLLWYCSDNGGLPNLGSSGGRGSKSQIYEGGLRVPAMLEWPARIGEPRVTDVPAVTSDIYPTLLEIAGVEIEHQPPLDGISLVPLIDGGMQARPRPLGFWHFPEAGIRVPSAQWMQELLQAQEANAAAVPDSFRLRLDAGDVNEDYPESPTIGHAAWLDWPWKLHRIESREGEVEFELYNLDADPDEARNLLGEQSERVRLMTIELQDWQRSVIASLIGQDYR